MVFYQYAWPSRYVLLLSLFTFFFWVEVAGSIGFRSLWSALSYSLNVMNASYLIGNTPNRCIHNAAPELLFNSLFDFFHDLNLLFSLQPFCFFIQDLYLLYLMMCNLEFILEMGVLIFQHFCFLDDPFCLYLVLLFVDFVIEPILFQS